MADDIKKNKAKIKNVAKKELKNQAVKRKIKVEKGGQKKTKVDTAKENKIRKIGVKKPVVNDSKKNETKIGKKRYLEKVILAFYGRNRSCQNRIGNILKKEVKL